MKDTRGTGGSWHVTATLVAEIKNDQGHVLSDGLTFVDPEGKETKMTIGTPVTVFKSTTVDTRETYV